MSKKKKNKILILLIYVISLFIFELVIGAIRTEDILLDLMNQDYSTPMIIYVPSVSAGIYHFVFVILVAIYTKLSKKIEKDYKRLIYSFPILTIIFTLPMGIVTTWICSLFGIYDNL